MRRYNPIDLSPEKAPSFTEEDDDDTTTEDDSSSGMDLMNDPEMQNVIQRSVSNEMLVTMSEVSVWGCFFFLIV